MRNQCDLGKLVVQNSKQICGELCWVYNEGLGLLSNLISHYF